MLFLLIGLAGGWVVLSVILFIALNNKAKALGLSVLFLFLFGIAGGGFTAYRLYTTARSFLQSDNAVLLVEENQVSAASGFAIQSGESSTANFWSIQGESLTTLRAAYDARNFGDVRAQIASSSGASATIARAVYAVISVDARFLSEIPVDAQAIAAFAQETAASSGLGNQSGDFSGLDFNSLIQSPEALSALRERMGDRSAFSELGELGNLANLESLGRDDGAALMASLQAGIQSMDPRLALGATMFAAYARQNPEAAAVYFINGVKEGRVIIDPSNFIVDLARIIPQNAMTQLLRTAGLGGGSSAPAAPAAAPATVN